MGAATFNVDCQGLLCRYNRVVHENRDRKCACGCGQRVVLSMTRFKHMKERGYPRYISGHNTRLPDFFERHPYIKRVACGLVLLLVLPVALSAQQVVTGNVTITVDVQNMAQVQFVQVQVDGKPFGGTLTTAPYVLKWNTKKVKKGIHVLSASAMSPDGLKAMGSVEVRVQ